MSELNFFRRRRPLHGFYRCQSLCDFFGNQLKIKPQAPSPRAPYRFLNALKNYLQWFLRGSGCGKTAEHIIGSSWVLIPLGAGLVSSRNILSLMRSITCHTWRCNTTDLSHKKTFKLLSLRQNKLN